MIESYIWTIEEMATMALGIETLFLIVYVFSKKKKLSDTLTMVLITGSMSGIVYSKVENTLKLEQQEAVSIAFLQKRMEHLDRELVHLYKMDMELKKVDLDADMYISQAMKIRTETLNKIDNKTYKVGLLRKDIEWARQWLPYLIKH